MAGARAVSDVDALRRVRARRAACRRGDDDPRPVPLSRRVTVYVGQGCHLCERALEVVEQARAEAPFALEIVDITGRDELELAYRELLPVVEIDGVRAFHHFVPPAAFRARL